MFYKSTMDSCPKGLGTPSPLHTNVRTAKKRTRCRVSAAPAVCGLLLLGAAAIFAARPFGEWQPAKSVDAGGLLAVNTPSLEGCPIESPDKHNLFFASNRDGGKGLIDIWVADREGAHHPWGAPSNLPEPVNSTYDDFCPTPLQDGRLLFVSARPSPCGGGTDIYETRLHPVKGWLEPKNLGCQVNSFGSEFSPSIVDAKGQVILFFSSNRLGTQQIFQSVLGSDGTWSPATPVSELNSPFEDARPNVRKDGLEIFFDSTRQGGAPDIWSAVRSSISEPWSAPFPLGPNVNTTAGESRPSLSRDGNRLYFGSTRGGGQGNSDIYMSTRLHGGKR